MGVSRYGGMSYMKSAACSALWSTISAAALRCVEYEYFSVRSIPEGGVNRPFEEYLPCDRTPDTPKKRKMVFM